MLRQSMCSAVRRRAARVLLAGGMVLAVAPRAQAQLWGANGVNVIIPPAQLFSAFAVNNSGQVVGGLRTGGSGIFTVGGDLTPLGTLAGATITSFSSINNLGQVAGVAVTGGITQAVTQLPGGDVQVLASPGKARASDINDHGQIAGLSLTIPEHPVIWDGGIATLLTAPSGVVNAINNSGQMVGSSGTVVTGGATLWDGSTTINILPAGPSPSVANDINDAGVVVGTKVVEETLPNGNNAGVDHGFVWANGVTQSLEEFAGGDGSLANAVSTDGTIVGESGGASLFGAAFWENVAGTYHIFSLSDIVNDGVVNSGWNIQHATAISDNGEYIIATASNAALGYSGRVILQQNMPVTSTPEPASLALVATGLTGVAGLLRRRKQA